MRKLIVYLITAAMLVTMLAVPVFAADPPTESGIYDLQKVQKYENTITVVPQKANGTAVQEKTVSLDGADKTLYPEAEKLALTYSRATANAYYLAVVIEADANYVIGTKPPDPTGDNLTYIDQQTATSGTGGGTVSFTLFPKEIKAGKTYLICLSGNGQALETVGSFKYFEYVPYTLGDIDADGDITALDALMALQIAGALYNPTENEYLAANVDRDDSVTAIDALMILQYAGNIISSWDD